MKGFAIVLFFCVAVSFAAEIKLSEDIAAYNFTLKLQNEILQLKEEIENLQNERKITVNINKYLDTTMKTVQLWIVKNGLDPYEAPDVAKGFSVKIGLITFHGEFELTHGWIQGLGTAERAGEATMSYAAEKLSIRLPIGFETILVNYDYLAKIMNLGPKGGVEAKIKNVQLLVDVIIDTSNFHFTLQGFRIVDSGKISLNFSGNALVDWLANALSRVFTRIMHDVVLGVLQNRVRELLLDMVNQINQGLHPEIGYVY